MTTEIDLENRDEKVELRLAMRKGTLFTIFLLGSALFLTAILLGFLGFAVMHLPFIEFPFDVLALVGLIFTTLPISVVIYNRLKSMFREVKL